MVVFVWTVSVIVLSLFSECLCVTVRPVVYRRRQSFDYGTKPFQMEYKGFYNPYLKPTNPLPYQHVPPPPIQELNGFYQQQPQKEPLALFVSKPEQPLKPLFENVIIKPPQNKPFEWQEQKQGFKPMAYPQYYNGFYEQQQQKHPQYPPLNEYYPGLEQPKSPVNLYVGFEQTTPQPPPDLKQTFNNYQPICHHDEPQTSTPQTQPPPPQGHFFGGHFLEPPKTTKPPQQVKIEPVEDFKDLFQQAKTTTSAPKKEEDLKIAFVKPDDQNLLKFSNEDAVQPLTAGKVQFANFSEEFGVGSGDEKPKPEKMKKRKPKRVRMTKESSFGYKKKGPKYTYIIRTRKQRET